MMAELKPCPFCGGKVFSYYVKSHKHALVGMSEYGGGGFVECSNCSCMLAANTKEEAERLWNTRTETKCDFKE